MCRFKIPFYKKSVIILVLIAHQRVQVLALFAMLELARDLPLELLVYVVADIMMMVKIIIVQV